MLSTELPQRYGFKSLIMPDIAGWNLMFDRLNTI
jgi:hypothetical protein